MGFMDIFRKQNQTVESKERHTHKQIKSVHGQLGYATDPSWNAFHGRTLLMEGYERNTWAFACIRKKMEAASSVPIVVKELVRGDGSDQEWEQVGEAHPVARIMESPCKGVTGAQFIQQIVGQLDVQGVFYAQIVRGGRGGNMPIELYPLPIGSVQAKIKNGEVVRYEVTSMNGTPVPINVENMLVVKHTSPDGATAITAPTSAGGKAIDVDNAAADLQKISLDNRGVPDGIFELDIEDDPDGENFEEARNIIRQQYATRDSFKEPWVLQNAKFTQLSQSLSDLDFMKGRAASRDEICSVYAVPPPLVGIYDDATLANIETARKIFWRDTIMPLLSAIQTQLTRGLQLGGNFQKLKIVFDTTTVSALQESYSEKLDAAAKLWDLGVPLTEINRRLELGLEVDDIPGASTGYLGSTKMPISGGDSDGGLSDREFERLQSIVSKVAAGELTVDAGVAMAQAALPDSNESRIRRILEGVMPAENEKTLKELEDRNLL